MNTETRSLASLLAADISEWGVGAMGVDPKTGEMVRENAILSRWCEWAPRIILSAVWPDGASEVVVHFPPLERVEEATGRPMHGRVYTHAEVFGDDETEGVIGLAVVAELWERRKLIEFTAWALDVLYPRYHKLTGEIHACQGRTAALEHICYLAKPIAV